MELASILIVIFHLQSCQCAASPKFVAINGFQLKLSILFMETISLQSCGYYFGLVDMDSSCGLWILFYFKLNVRRVLEPRWYKMHWARLEKLRMTRIWKYLVDRSVDTFLFHAELLQKCYSGGHLKQKLAQNVSAIYWVRTWGLVDAGSKYFLNKNKNKRWVSHVEEKWWSAWVVTPQRFNFSTHDIPIRKNP